MLNKPLKTHLFLHMGPGENAARNGRCSRMNILLWILGPIECARRGCICILVSKVFSRVKELQAQAGTPIHLISHSFGGLLIMHMLKIILPLTMR